MAPTAAAAQPQKPHNIPMALVGVLVGCILIWGAKTHSIPEGERKHTPPSPRFEYGIRANADEGKINNLNPNPAPLPLRYIPSTSSPRSDDTIDRKRGKFQPRPHSNRIRVSSAVASISTREGRMD